MVFSGPPWTRSGPPWTCSCPTWKTYDSRLDQIWSTLDQIWSTLDQFWSTLNNLRFEVGPVLVHPGPDLVHPGPVLVQPGTLQNLRLDQIWSNLKFWSVPGWTRTGPGWTRSGPGWTRTGPTSNLKLFRVDQNWSRVDQIWSRVDQIWSNLESYVFQVGQEHVQGGPDLVQGGPLNTITCHYTTSCSNVVQCDDGRVGAHLCASQCKEVCEACRFLCKYILASIKHATISTHYQILGFSNTEIKAIWSIWIWVSSSTIYTNIWKTYNYTLGGHVSSILGRDYAID